MLNAARNSFGFRQVRRSPPSRIRVVTLPEFFENQRGRLYPRKPRMQSASSHVLQILERAHTPAEAFAAAKEAKAAVLTTST